MMKDRRVSPHRAVVLSVIAVSKQKCGTLRSRADGRVGRRRPSLHLAQSP